jgi:GNAT superfamily N-acetyltransferase
MLMEMKKYDSPSNDGIIYELSDNNNLIGGAKIVIANDVLLLKALYVKPEYRQQKYGSFILDHIEKDNINNVSRIQSELLLFSDIGYDNLILFYEKNGYEYNIFNMIKQINRKSQA